MKKSALPRFRFPLAFKLSLALSLLTIVSMISLWGLLQNNLENLLRKQVDMTGQTLADQLALSATEMVLAAHDRLSLLGMKIMLENLTKQREVTGAAIYDDQFHTLAGVGKLQPLDAKSFSKPQTHHSSEATHNNPLRVYTQSIRFVHESNLDSDSYASQSTTIGYVQINIDTTSIKETIDDSRSLLTVATICMLFVCFILSSGLARHLVKPISRLQKAASAIGAGRLTTSIDREGRNDELGELIQDFNRMAKGLAEKILIEDTFTRYMPESIANNLIAQPSNPRIPLESNAGSIMFVDIIGFTSLCDGQPPEVIANWLNEYYFYIHSCCSNYHGTVDKYMGDGALVIFGLPEFVSNHSLEAICAARFFLEMMKALNQRNRDVESPEIRCRLAIHSGELLAGTLGASQRMQYTVIGDNVNLASHLCDIAQADVVTITQEVYEQPGVADAILVKESFSLEVRGKSTPIAGYQVLSLRADYEKRIQAQIQQLMALPDSHQHTAKEAEARSS